MKYEVIKDIEFIKDYLSLNETTLCKLLDIPRSTLNYWKKNEDKISFNSLCKVYDFAYENNIRLNKAKEQIYRDLGNNTTKILFHGAKEKIEGDLSLLHSKDNNDFGKGFYLGENLYQSASFVSNYPSSNIYICKYKINKNLNVLEFDISQEWMLAISFFRNRIKDYSKNRKISSIIDSVNKADIIIAPIADNNMYMIIENFIEGVISDKQCLNALSATNLGKQYVFKTEKALKSLTVLEQCFLCNKERNDYIKEKELNNSIGSQKAKMAQRKYAGKGKYIEELFT